MVTGKVVDETACEKTVGDKCKAAVDATDAPLIDDFLFDHGRLLIFGFYDLRTMIDSALSSSPSLQSTISA